jgi:hypothetical protein
VGVLSVIAFVPTSGQLLTIEGKEVIAFNSLRSLRSGTKQITIQTVMQTYVSA